MDTHDEIFEYEAGVWGVPSFADVGDLEVGSWRRKIIRRWRGYI